MPTAIVPYYDRVHPMSAAAHAAEVIPDCTLFDFDPSRHDDPLISTDDSATVARILAEFDGELARRQKDRRIRRRRLTSLIAVVAPIVLLAVLAVATRLPARAGSRRPGSLSRGSGGGWPAGRSRGSDTRRRVRQRHGT